MNNKKILIISAVVLISILIVYGGVMVNQFFSKNTKFTQSEVFVFIPTGSSYDDVKEIISPFVQDMNRFEEVAKRRGYLENLEAGRFRFTPGMSSYELIKSLRTNLPVKLSYNNLERLEDFASKVSKRIEPDSLSLIKVCTDSIFLAENGFNKENVFVMFLPNTYEVYWNSSAEEFRDKMIKEYRRYWDEERTKKASKLGLSPIQATILASIVHKESVKEDERPRIAGVYLNRLKQQMPLQADPTVIFAKKKNENNFNQIIKRVFYKDLQLISPYNTYCVTGLPPGPIAMADLTALEAVLNPETHNYIFFCASVDRFGYHEFAANLAEHSINAQKYSDWISSKQTVQ